MNTEQLTLEVSHLKDLLNVQNSYFTEGLAIQTGLFVLIVGLLGVFNFVQYKREMKNEIKKISSALKEELYLANIKEFQKFKDEYTKEINEEILKHNIEISLLNGNFSRSFALFLNEKGDKSSAFLWCMRTAKHFCKTDLEETSESLVRGSLIISKKILNESTDKLNIEYKFYNEIEQIIFGLNDERYKKEKEDLIGIMNKKINILPNNLINI